MYKFIDNKYTKLYFSIINNAQNRANNRKAAKKIIQYVEGHHIFPISIIKNNEIVYLSVKEHFICHWLLTKMVAGQDLYKMYHAMTFFTKRKTLTPFEVNVMLSFKHKPCSNSRRKNISESRLLTEKKLCPHCNKEYDPGNYSQYHGDNCRKNPNVSIDMLKQRTIRGKTNVKNQMMNGTWTAPIIPTGIFTCPHCGKTGTNFGNMHLHHFDNCYTIKIKLTKTAFGGNIKCSCIKCHKTFDIGNFTKHKCGDFLTQIQPLPPTLNQFFQEEISP